jgi:hypothetical protein
MKALCSETLEIRRLRCASLSRNDAVGNRKTCGVVAAMPSSQEVPAAPRRDAVSVHGWPTFRCLAETGPEGFRGQYQLQRSVAATTGDVLCPITALLRLRMTTRGRPGGEEVRQSVVVRCRILAMATQAWPAFNLVRRVKRRSPQSKLQGQVFFAKIEPYGIPFIAILPHSFEPLMARLALG